MPDPLASHLQNYDKRLSIILPVLCASEMRHRNQEPFAFIFVTINVINIFTKLITDIMSFSYLFTRSSYRTAVLRGQENSKLSKLIHNRRNLDRIKAICMPVPIWDLLKEITSY